MMTSSADFFGNFGCGSTGNARPCRWTVKIRRRFKLDLDEGGMAGQRLVHGILDDFRRTTMVESFSSVPPSILAGRPPHRAKILRGFDVERRYSPIPPPVKREATLSDAAALGSAEPNRSFVAVLSVGLFQCFGMFSHGLRQNQSRRDRFPD